MLVAPSYWFFPDELPEHPLRKELNDSDWQRIQEVLDRKIPEHNATVEEIDAAHDILYDAIAAKMQTHESVPVLH